MIAFLQYKRTKIVATRHDFWAQNVSEMFLRPGLHREACWGRSFPDPLASRQGREGEAEGKWKVERWREDEGNEGKGEGMEGGEGKEGREGKGKGRQRVGVVVLGGGLTSLT